MRIEDFAQKVFDNHPTRFRRKEKDSFLESTKEYLKANGYEDKDIQITEHKDEMNSRNLVVGNPAAPYVFTAHYDTPGKTGWMLFTSKLFGQTGANIFLLVLIFGLQFLATKCAMSMDGFFDWNFFESAIGTSFATTSVALVFLVILFVTTITKNKNNRNDNTSGVLGVLHLAALAQKDPELRDKCCFILFDNEEWGLYGSRGYAQWLKKNKIDTKESRVINLDCIGCGDILLAAKTLGKNTVCSEVAELMKGKGVKTVKKTSSMIFMSDHANFKNSVMLSYVDRSVFGPLYIPNVHTSKDIECDMEKVKGLSEALCDAVRG